MRIFLHVGPHKTGTTLIQKTFLDNQQRILAGGLFYPRQYLRVFGHHEFRDRIAERRLNISDVKFLHESGKDILLSSEDFISLEVEDYQYLKETFKSADFTVLYGWRRASNKLYSIWQETVKHGGFATFLSYHAQHLANPATSAMLSADIKLKMFSSVFGKQNIRIFDYDASLKSDSLLVDFFGLINRKMPVDLRLSAGDRNAENRSMDLADTEIIRVLNYLFYRRKGIEGSAVRIAYNKYALENLNVENVKQMIRNDINEFLAGKLFVDLRCEKIMGEQYRDNILNYSYSLNELKVYFAGQNWLLNGDAHSLIEAIFNDISELI